MDFSLNSITDIKENKCFESCTEGHLLPPFDKTPSHITGSYNSLKSNKRSHEGNAVDTQGGTRYCTNTRSSRLNMDGRKNIKIPEKSIELVEPCTTILKIDNKIPKISLPNVVLTLNQRRRVVQHK